MASLATYTADRATAGAAYALAAKNLVDAWVELHALDQVVSNPVIAMNAISVDIPGIVSEGPIGGPVSDTPPAPAFNGPPALPFHPPFLPSANVADVGVGAVARAQVRMQALLTTYATGLASSSFALAGVNAARATNRAAVLALRNTAGAAYAATVTPLANAYVELGAYDMVLENNNVAGGPQTKFSGPLHYPHHAEYLRASPSGTASGVLNDRIRARHIQLLAS